MVTELKRIPENATTIEAGGTVFTIHSSLSVDGYQWLEELSIESEAGDSAAGMLKNQQAAYKLINEARLADAAVKLYNSIAAGERITEKQYNARLLIFTLFCRPQGSDLTAWNRDEAAVWLDTLNKAGYDSADLFSKAIGFQLSYLSNSTTSFPTISGNENEGEGTGEAQESPVANRKKK